MRIRLVRCLRSFNSIKVRLNLNDCAAGSGRLLRFNSIKVRLNPLIERRQLEIKARFNSIKVRLNLSLCNEVTQFSMFQFHKGTIKP